MTAADRVMVQLFFIVVFVLITILTLVTQSRFQEIDTNFHQLQTSVAGTPVK